MLLYRTKGAKIKALREARDRKATQKELADEARISERALRNIENRDAPTKREVLERLGAAFGVSWRELAHPLDGLRLVADNAPADSSSADAPSGRWYVPRFDSTHALLVTDAADLINQVFDADVLVSHVAVPLLGETAAYVEELIGLLAPLVFTPRGLTGDEVALRRRARELLVLLKGNDIQVYLARHLKHLPESDVILERPDPLKMESQAVLAFGPGPEAEPSLEVPVDNGQPYVIDLDAALPF